MAGEDARLKSGLKTAEDELNLIKNQIQQTLLDIREHILDVTNPFNDVEKALGDEEEMAIEDSGGGGGGGGGSVEDGLSDASADSAGEDEESSEELDSEEGDALSEDEMYDDDLPEEDFEEIPEDDVYGSDPMSGGGYGDPYPPEQMYDAPLDELEPGEEEILDDDVLDELTDDVEEPEDVQEDAVTENTAENAMVADGELDLIKLASLVRWVAVTQSRLGPQRTEVLLDTYVAAGRISAQVRNVMGLISDMADEDPDGSIPVRDIIASMVRMEGVLSVGTGSSSPNRLLGMLLELDDDPLDRLAA